MPLSGVHIAFGFAASSLGNQQGQTTLIGPAVSSQTMASAGTSTISAPSNGGTDPIVCSVAASAAIFFATGKTPNADGTTAYPRRYYDPATGPLDAVVKAGDLFAWILA